MPNRASGPVLAFALFLLVPQAALFAQTPIPAPASIKAAPVPAADPYAAEPAVVERQESIYRMAADGTGTHEMSQAVRIQSEASLKEAGVVGVGFAANSQKVEFVYVRARHKDGTVTETPPSAAMEVLNPVTQAAPFYSDLKQMQLPVRTLGVGDTLEWRARVITVKPEVPNQFWGDGTFPANLVVLSDTIELHVPKGMYVNTWTRPHPDSPGSPSKPSDTIAGDERIIRWTHESRDPTVGPAADAAKEARKKHVLSAAEELDEKEGKLPDVAWTTYKTWQEVGAWYRALEGDRMLPSPEIKAKVAELTAGKATEEEKVEAVYRFVSAGVRYIGVAFGIGRYQPHVAGTVLENQYGDCKDKHTLLAAMLQVLGLQPDAVLIGAGIRFNEAVPSPAAFNHLITHVVVSGRPVFLDTTAEVGPYAALMYPIRDHQALVVPQTGAAHIETTPAALPFQQVQTMEAVGTLAADGTELSHITFTERGDAEMTVRAVARQLTTAQYDLLAQQICGAMGYAGTASHTDISRPDDTSAPLKLSYDYKREKPGDWEHLSIPPQLAPLSVPRVDEADPPTQSIALGETRVESSTASLTLPKDWGVMLPEAVHARSPYASVDETYKFDKGVLSVQRRLEILKDKVPVSDWKTYQKWTEGARMNEADNVQLVRHGEGALDGSVQGAAGIKISGGDNGMKARQLISSANILIGEKQFDLARKGLDQAQALDAQAQYLWSTYAFLEYRKGAYAQSIEDSRKELAVHPESSRPYGIIADAQWQMNQHAEAETTLRKWIAVDSANSQPSLLLARYLLTDGHPAAAAGVAEAGLAAATTGGAQDGQLKVVLGHAQLEAGQTAKGRATLSEVLQSTSDSSLLNDAAYHLADAGFELPLAETSARKAIDKLEEESLNRTLDERADVATGKTHLLQASWDTLGWIYFKQGKLEQAQDYIYASWLGRQDLAVGSHLAEVQAAHGNKDAALDTYLLALASSANFDDKAPHLTRVDELRRQGARASVKDANEALRKQRVFPIGSAGGLSGSTEYRLLIHGEKVEQARRTGTTWMKGSDEKVNAALLPGLVPKGSGGRLVLSAMFNCHQEVCELILLP